MFSNKITEITHQIIEPHIRQNSVIIDTTVGKGNDTLFFAKKLNNGLIYGFDVQKKAIDITKEKLYEYDLYKNVILIHDSHENIKQHIEVNIDAAIMNLGYLPGGDKKIITKPDSTIKAISSIIELLHINGGFVLTSYYGHPGGQEEKQAIENHLSILDIKKYMVIKLDQFNRKNNPPIIFYVKRIK